MMISREKINDFNTLLLVLILATIFFPSVSTFFLTLFIILNLYNYKALKFNKKKRSFILILMLPFLMELLFIWTSLDRLDILKHIEKKLSFLIIPFFVIPNYKNYSFLKIGNYYRYLFTLIVVILLIRFGLLFPEYVVKYLNGIHLWEMGYVISNSFGNHAPAVNLHVAYLVILNLYFLFKNLKTNGIINGILLLISLAALLIINTRVSLLSVIICGGFIALYFAYTKYRSRAVYYLGGFSAICLFFLVIAFNTNPYMKEKYTKVTFSNIEMIGRLDEIENPDEVLHNALVTRLTIWDTTINLAKEKIWFGHGSANGKPKLFEYYQKTNQKFLSKYNFPVHNQFLDYLLKFGLLGFILLIGYFVWLLWLAIQSKNILGLTFIVNFFLSNIFDDFLIRFDGIVFSAIWFTLIVVFYLKNKSRTINSL